jgi:hypothetical protein
MYYRKPLILTLLLFLIVFKSSAQEFEKNLRKTYSLLTIAQERDRQAAEKLDDLKTKRIQSEEDLVDFKEISKPTANQKKEREKLDIQLKLLRKQEAEALKQRKDAAVFLNEVADIVKTTESKRAKYITDYEKKFGRIDEGKLVENVDATPVTPNPAESVKPDPIAVLENPVNDAASETPTDKSKKPKKEDKKKKTESKPNSKPKTSTAAAPDVRQVRKYDPENDVIINPPVSDCRIAFDGVDQFTERKKKETMPQQIFAHTEEFMRPALKNKDYIVCEAAASRIQGGFYFINLTITIQTKEAQKAFGFLDKGTPIVFKLINGKNIALTNSKTDIGTINNENGTTIYKSQLQISSSDVKSFMESELDVMRIAWSAGYEDYEIYDLEVLSNIFKCLEKENK